MTEWEDILAFPCVSSLFCRHEKIQKIRTYLRASLQDGQMWLQHHCIFKSLQRI